MREIRQSGSEGGARFNPLSLPLSGAVPGCALGRTAGLGKLASARSLTNTRRMGENHAPRCLRRKLPISIRMAIRAVHGGSESRAAIPRDRVCPVLVISADAINCPPLVMTVVVGTKGEKDRKSTRLNSSHLGIS